MDRFVFPAPGAGSPVKNGLTEQAGDGVRGLASPSRALFDYQDGELRDHVDERKIPAAWLAAAQRALGQFQDRLEQVKRHRNAGVAAINQWGDVSIRWQRT